MAKKSEHPDSKLFDYLNGKTEEAETRFIEEHLFACDECAEGAAVVRAFKNEISDSTARSSQHPDVSELASFFYSTSEGVSSQVAGHVASCLSCAEEIAQYAAGERAASQYQVANRTRAEMPVKAWELISEWEESSFAKLKPAGDVINRELLERLPRILKAERHHTVSGTRDAARVPVLVISGSGEVHSVEYFEESIDPSGARVLRHTEGSASFDKRVVHALLDIEGKEPLVISELIQSDTLRFEQAERFEEVRSADFFIIEE
ncbi:MAG TPA: zf-HC2 domain-containing protein [Blastocatellia bacterium]|nr:zf-HC2 domain-containing protein [Blastocatellia bacterium]